MSKQEILSWTSLATSVSFMIFYLLFNFGWPDAVPDYSGSFFKTFFNLFWIAVVIEIIVEISEGNRKVQKDERDFIIEARGIKVAYNILVIAIVGALVQIFISNLGYTFGSDFPLHLEMSTIFHFLIIALFLGSATRRSIMIYHYRKDF
ncbi:MAG: hypothetical protein ABJR05_01285 [Balneola sp.]